MPPKNVLLKKANQKSYRHAGAALGEIDDRWVKLVFEEISMGNDSPSQCQTGGSHQGCSNHFGIRVQLQIL